MKNVTFNNTNVSFDAGNLMIDGEEVITDGYELLDLTNHGANGLILKAKEILTKKEVALKIWLNNKDDSRKQSVNEIKKIESLDENEYSPYMVHYRGSGLFGKYSYCAIDFLEPQEYLTLKEYLRDDLSLCERYNIINQIVKGLRTAHKYNIYHGDLHSKNILVERHDKTIKIIDFGTSFRNKEFSRYRDNKLMLETTKKILGKFNNEKIMLEIDKKNLPPNAVRLIIKAYEKILVLLSFENSSENEEIVKSIALFCSLVPFFNIFYISEILFRNNNISENREKLKKIYLDKILEIMIKKKVINRIDLKRSELERNYRILQKKFIEICKKYPSEVNIYFAINFDDIKRFNENLYFIDLSEEKQIEEMIE